MSATISCRIDSVLLLLPVFCCRFHRVTPTSAQRGAECPGDQAEGAEVGSLSKVTMEMQMPALEWTSTASFARVVVLLVLLCVVFLDSTAMAQCFGLR